MRWDAVAWALGIFGGVIACGGRTPLRTDGAGAASGGDGAGGAGADSSTGGLGGAGVPPPPCAYAPPEQPLELFKYGEGVHSPSIVALDRGAPGTDARVAVAAMHEHFWHPNLRVAEVGIGEPWPGGVSVANPMVEYGIDAHAGGAPVRRVGDAAGLALVYYHGDEANPNITPGVMFRRFNAASWLPEAELFVDTLGDSVFSTVQGEVLDAGGRPAGEGYGVTWRSAAGDLSVPLLTVLDENGQPTFTPIATSAPGAYPGGSATVAWTGERYLVGGVWSSCGAGEPCAPNEVFVKRLEMAPSGPQLVDSGAVFALPGYAPRRPTIASHRGATFMLWRERPAFVNEEPDVVRLARIGDDGAIVGDLALASRAPLLAGPFLRVSDQGVFVMWGEALDSTLPPEEIGHSALVVQAFDREGAALDQLSIPTSALSGGTLYAAEPVDHPRSMIVAWSAAGATSQVSSVFLTRLACDPVE